MLGVSLTGVPFLCNTTIVPSTLIWMHASFWILLISKLPQNLVNVLTSILTSIISFNLFHSSTSVSMTDLYIGWVLELKINIIIYFVSLFGVKQLINLRWGLKLNLKNQLLCLFIKTNYKDRLKFIYPMSP